MGWMQILKVSLDILTKELRQDVKSMGGKIYQIGGAVRDEFLGEVSKDLDLIITGIDIEDLQELLNKHGKVNLVGKSFGVLKFNPTGEEGEPGPADGTGPRPGADQGLQERERKPGALDHL